MRIKSVTNYFLHGRLWPHSNVSMNTIRLEAELTEVYTLITPRMMMIACTHVHAHITVAQEKKLSLLCKLEPLEL